MKVTSSYLIVLIAALGLCACQSSQQKAESASAYPEEAHGFKLSVGSYSFKNFTFLETLPKLDSCQVKYTEGFPSHPLGGDFEGTLDYKMDSVTRTRLKKLLDDKGVRLAAYGVVTPKTNEDWDQLFAFASFMGVENISSEPSLEQLPYVSGLCDRYGINVAIHNHPAPSRYWHPDSVLKAIDGQSPRIGAAADVGHWMRSGLDPVECLQKLEGRLFHFHLKDLSQIGVKEAHDVLWGEGASNMEGIIEEIKRQKFSGIVSAEYEYNWDNNTQDIAKCLTYFRSKL
jgi:sugar phosphate isomerase/epimerase